MCTAVEVVSRESLCVCNALTIATKNGLFHYLDTKLALFLFTRDMCVVHLLIVVVVVVVVCGCSVPSRREWAIVGTQAIQTVVMRGGKRGRTRAIAVVAASCETVTRSDSVRRSHSGCTLCGRSD